MKSLLSRAWRSPTLLLTVTMLFWAGNSIAGRAMAGVVPPLALSFWRWTLAFALVTTVAWPHVKRDRAVLIARWPLILALAATGVATFGALLYVGLHTTTALNSVLLQAAIPPLIMLFAWLFQGERTSTQQTVGVVLSLAGVLVVISHGRPWDLLHLGLKPGDALISIGVVVYAIYALILRKRPAVHPLSLLWATFAMAALLLAPFYGFEAMAGAKLTISTPMLLGLGYVAVFPSFLAYLFFNRGVELAGPARAGHFMHLMPIFGGLLAVTLLGEAFAPFHAVGAVLIGLGIATASLGRRPEKTA
jgi:drug/metabolite transporter (DMT)-like permease